MIKIYKVNKEHPNLLDQLNQKKTSGTVFIYSDNCHHCMEMKPQWEQMKQKMRNKPANIYEINGDDLHYINHPIKNIVDGFPMILNVNNRNITPFDEERTSRNLIKFAESNILKMKPENYLSGKNTVKRVTFNNKNNLINGNKIGDSLNLDNYITKKLPFLNVKKVKTAKKRKTPKTHKTPKPTKPYKTPKRGRSSKKVGRSGKNKKKYKG